MIVYLTANLHLNEARPDLTELFLHLMYGEAGEAQTIYVFGDLLDFWIGDDERFVLTDATERAIHHLTGCGVKCYSIHGNRDFLFGKRLATETDMILLSEYQMADLLGRKMLICYGDALRTGDTHYQQFRCKVHQKWWQKLFLLLPLPLRVGITKKIHQTSRQDRRRKTVEIMDVSLRTMAETVGGYGTGLLIHDHIYRQNIHRNGRFMRIVLGG